MSTRDAYKLEQVPYAGWRATFLGETFESNRQDDCTRWLLEQRSAFKMETSPRMGVFAEYRHNGLLLMQDTIATWDRMIAAGFNPTCAGMGMITMTDYAFKKAFAGRQCTKFNTKSAECLSVWDGHVEITCTVTKHFDPNSEIVCPSTT